MSAFDEVAANIRAEGGDPAGFLALRAEGKEIAGLLLDHVHHEASARTHPDILALTHQMRAWDAKVQQAIFLAYPVEE